MLKSLSVSNLAVVEKAEVEFAPGLNVITGETGAGKSVLMGALELLLGGRAEAQIVREGAAEAEVEAVFGSEGRRKKEEGKSEGETVIRRTVTASGRSRAWINDESVTLAELKAYGAVRVDIHGPRANQKILEEDFQREALDSFGGLNAAAAEGSRRTESRRASASDALQGYTRDTPRRASASDALQGYTRDTPRRASASDAHVRANYEVSYASYLSACRAYEELAAKTVSEDEMDLLRYQVNEIESAHLCADDETLAERHAAAAHAADLTAAANEITEGLSGDGGAADTLARLQPLFAAAAKHFPAAAEWAKTAEEMTVSLQELSRTIADAVSAIETDPAALDELDERLTLVSRLKRKYGDPLAKLAEKKARLDEMENRGERLAALAEAKAKCEVEVKAAGEKLTAKRRAAAEKLAKRVTKGLVDLGFRQAKFAVALEPCAPAAHGCDRVTYMFEPNPGEPSRPLAAIASSGETARVMLALKEALAEHDATDLLVFDEIDANIGGEVGSIVGAKMRAVAKSHQVVAITHLPQSAAYGAHHLVVSKSVDRGRTRTHVSAVTGEARVAEIARMLGGGANDAVVKAHAEKLLSRSGLS